MNRTRLLLAFLGLASVAIGQPAPAPFNGLSVSMDNISRLSSAKSRSISAENFTGEKGKGGMATEGTNQSAARNLGQGWKVSPAVALKAGSTLTLAEITGPGSIQQMWLTPTGNWRRTIIRFYWDDETEPSVECPVGDFFASGWGKFAQINSLAVCVNPGRALNCYWPMPFRKKARITIENLDSKDMKLYYQINYALSTVPDDEAYFHAQFRRVNPLPEKEVYTIVEGIKGRGHYVGTYMAWEARSPGWWGEGEIKFYMDGDRDWPTICGTGLEDYFCGSYDWVDRKANKYITYSGPYAGLTQVLPTEEAFVPPQRFSLYRWHITDPVRFEQDLRVTIQALGWNMDRSYLPLKDDIASVAFWYQTEPHAPFPKLPTASQLDVN